MTWVSQTGYVYQAAMQRIHELDAQRQRVAEAWAAFLQVREQVDRVEEVLDA